MREFRKQAPDIFDTEKCKLNETMKLGTNITSRQEKEVIEEQVTKEQDASSCITKLPTRALEASTSIQGLCGLSLVVSGLQQLTVEDLSHETVSSETYQSICILILISGIFLVLWTVFGWILYVKKLRTLYTTSGASNIVLLLLVFFLFSSNQIPVIFLFGAAFSFLLTFLHIFFLGLLKIFSKLKIQHKNKVSSVNYSLSFHPEVYKC